MPPVRDFPEKKIEMDRVQFADQNINKNRKVTPIVEKLKRENRNNDRKVKGDQVNNGVDSENDRQNVAYYKKRQQQQSQRQPHVSPATSTTATPTTTTTTVPAPADKRRV